MSDNLNKSLVEGICENYDEITILNNILNNLNKSLVEDVSDGKALLVSDLAEVCSPCIESLGHPKLGERLHQACLEAGGEAGERV